MRVRFTSDCVANIEGRVEEFTKGQEFDGPFADQLVAGGCPVVEVDSVPGFDENGLPDGNAAGVLAWVGVDSARAVLALQSENGRDKPRSTLVAALEKIAASGS